MGEVTIQKAMTESNPKVKDKRDKDRGEKWRQRTKMETEREIETETAGTRGTTRLSNLF